MITDKIAPIHGSISRNGRLRIGVFTQHSADKFDLELSSVENMLAIFSHAVDQEMVRTEMRIIMVDGVGMLLFYLVGV